MVTSQSIISKLINVLPYKETGVAHTVIWNMTVLALWVNWNVRFHGVIPDCLECYHSMSLRWSNMCSAIPQGWDPLGLDIRRVSQDKVYVISGVGDIVIRSLHVTWFSTLQATGMVRVWRVSWASIHEVHRHLCVSYSTVSENRITTAMSWYQNVTILLVPILKAQPRLSSAYGGTVCGVSISPLSPLSTQDKTNQRLLESHVRFRKFRSGL